MQDPQNHFWGNLCWRIVGMVALNWQLNSSCAGEHPVMMCGSVCLKILMSCCQKIFIPCLSSLCYFCNKRRKFLPKPLKLGCSGASWQWNTPFLACSLNSLPFSFGSLLDFICCGTLFVSTMQFNFGIAYDAAIVERTSTPANLEYSSIIGRK